MIIQKNSDEGTDVVSRPVFDIRLEVSEKMGYFDILPVI